MRKTGKIAFVGAFCAVIGLAFPVFNVFSKQLSMDSHENRLMTGLPQVLNSPLRELPQNLDNFLVDNSPFRYQFVLVNAGLDYALFTNSWREHIDTFTMDMVDHPGCDILILEFNERSLDKLLAILEAF